MGLWIKLFLSGGYGAVYTGIVLRRRAQEAGIYPTRLTRKQLIHFASALYGKIASRSRGRGWRFRREKTYTITNAMFAHALNRIRNPNEPVRVYHPLDEFLAEYGIVSLPPLLPESKRDQDDELTELAALIERGDTSPEALERMAKLQGQTDPNKDKF